MKKNKAEAIKKYEIVQYCQNTMEATEQLISEEMPLTIYLNGEEMTTMLCSPVDQRPLVMGFLVSEGMIRSIEDIKEIEIQEEDGLAYVEAEVTEKKASDGYLKRCLTTCCGRGRSGIYFSNDHTTTSYNASKAVYKAEDILRCSRQLLTEASETHRVTNGVHSGAVAADGDILLYSEDVGRHNIFDKLYGKCLEEKVSMEDKLIVFSGRISSEILIKVNKMQIPCVVAKSVPTTLALGLAEDFGITVVGRMRKDSFCVYTHPERIVV